MNKDDDEDCSLEDSLLWSRELEKHSYGEFSFAVVQANEVIEDNSQVETGPDATFVGVYDGHGGPDASRFICDHLFRNLMSESLTTLASLPPICFHFSPFWELFWVLTVLLCVLFGWSSSSWSSETCSELSWILVLILKSTCTCCLGLLFGFPVPLEIDLVKSVDYTWSIFFCSLGVFWVGSCLVNSLFELKTLCLLSLQWYDNICFNYELWILLKRSRTNSCFQF